MASSLLAASSTDFGSMTIAELQQKLQERANEGSSTLTDRLNLRLLNADLGLCMESVNPVDNDQSNRRPTRIAIVSLLFNWPSTGGGIVHTAELARFLSVSGYEVKHFFAVQQDWQIGSVSEPLPYPHEPLHFEQSEWNPEEIRRRFQTAVAQFDPDAVIVTDSWNTKVLLAEAVAEYPYFIRLAAMECICPLNNVRLIPDQSAQPHQCDLNQLKNHDACVRCVRSNPNASGGLHVAERELAGFFERDYGQRIQVVFKNAAGVLAVNQQIADLVRPYSARAHVIPSGFDESRFDGLPEYPTHLGPFRILFAGLVEEYMKGFHVLLAACRSLWEERQDFEVWVTGDNTGLDDPFLKFLGWQSQEDLPKRMADCDIVAVPTVAQEALGRTAVEAMGAGRAVITSRLGGLKETVLDGVTGSHVAPADPYDLMQGIKRLMDDRAWTMQLGRNGRKHFLKTYPWRVILNRYEPIFEECRRRVCT